MLRRQPSSGLPKLTDQRTAPAQPSIGLQHTTGGVMANQPQPYQPQPMQPFSTGIRTPGGLTDVPTPVAPVSPYNVPLDGEWYKDEWMKFSIPEQRQMTAYLPHERTLIFAARRYGNQMVKVVDETTGQITEMTGFEAATKVGQMADARLHQGYLDKQAGRRAEMGIRQQQEIPYRITAA
jgi:hypothetical protein